LAPLPASAFCGFYVGGADRSLYNDATVVVLMREGTRTVLSMQNSYQGPPERFAMVVPVPVVLQQDNVRTLDRAVFERVDQLAAPRLVEYWEQDPCARPPLARSTRALPGAPPASAARARRSSDDLGVRIEAQFAVAEYDIVILSAQDSSGLDTWLRREGYHIPANAEPALRPYVEAGTKFFVARVDPARVTFQSGRAVLSPLRVHYDSDTFSLPVRLGLINSAGTQDLLVHILARNQRYEVANYPNVTIPTNLEVRSSAREQFGAFYAALFDATRERHRGAVVTEYAWQAGSCDPCPGPTLSGSDIATLGGDVVGAGGSPEPRGRGRFGWNAASDWTLTRLHHRYDRNGLSEDLVFRAAPPLLGGRGTPNRNGRLDREVTPGGVNNFQGRYAILHRWNRPITCENPRRGIWGGPPSGGGERPVAARNLATQPRGPSLRSFLTRPMPELEPPRTRGGGDRRAAPETVGTLGAVASPAPVTVAAATGCSVSADGASSRLAGLMLALVAMTFLRRRRR
jgi:MYXO-CTERM domain-containing protein